MSNLQYLLNAAIDQRELLARRLDEVKVDRDRLAAEVERLITNRDQIALDLQKCYEKRGEREAVHRGDMREVTEDRDRLAAELAAMTAARDRVLDGNTEMVRKMVDERNALEDDRDRLAARVGELERERDKLQEELAHELAGETLARLSANVSSLVKQLEKSESELERAKARIAELEVVADADKHGLAAALERMRRQAETDRRKLGEWRLAAELGEELTRILDGKANLHGGEVERFREAMAKAGEQ